MPETFPADVEVQAQTMAETLSERELGFSEGLQAAIDYFNGCASAIGKIEGNATAERTALLIMVSAYQSDLRRLKKRSDAEIQAALNVEIARSA